MLPVTPSSLCDFSRSSTAIEPSTAVEPAQRLGQAKNFGGAATPVPVGVCCSPPPSPRRPEVLAALRAPTSSARLIGNGHQARAGKHS